MVERRLSTRAALVPLRQLAGVALLLGLFGARPAAAQLCAVARQVEMEAARHATRRPRLHLTR